MGGIDFSVAELVGLHTPMRAGGVVEIRLPPKAGGFCVVASAFARIDFFFDFVAVCECIGADAAAAVASFAD
jgi:hypothetical protein